MVIRDRYTLTEDKAQFLEYPGPKISYADTALADELFFKSTPLLFETGTRYFELSGIDAREGEIHLKGFFATANSTLPFDAFASAFYLAVSYTHLPLYYAPIQHFVVLVEYGL